MSQLRSLPARLLYRSAIVPPGGLNRLPVRFNQVLFEKGLRPPWVWTADRCRDYWASQTQASGANRPQEYANKSLEIVGVLGDFWTPEVGPESSIMEIGTNAGANLAGLWELGYRHLSGVEINEHAIAEMRSRFTQLENVNVMNGSLEDVLPALESRSADVVLSMAVLLHVHPKSNPVMQHMARIACRYVCTLECETATLAYIFARDYRRMFESFGCRQIRTELLTADRYPMLGSDYIGYRARLFSVES